MMLGKERKKRNQHKDDTLTFVMRELAMLGRDVLKEVLKGDGSKAQRSEVKRSNGLSFGSLTTTGKRVKTGSFFSGGFLPTERKGQSFSELLSSLKSEKLIKRGREPESRNKRTVMLQGWYLTFRSEKLNDVTAQAKTVVKYAEEVGVDIKVKKDAERLKRMVARAVKKIKEKPPAILE